MLTNVSTKDVNKLKNASKRNQVIIEKFNNKNFHLFIWQKQTKN